MFESLVFPQDARILEVGFGHGYWAAWASRQVPNGFVLGVDIDPNMVRWAQQQYPPSLFSNLEFRLGDACELDFDSEAFDYVMSNACLHYLDHPGMAFQAMARHLRPGGKLCVICLGSGNLRELHRTVEKVMREPRWAAYFHGFKTYGQLADGISCEPWLRKAGLVKRQARLFNEAINFPTPFAFADWFNGNFGRYLEAVPEALRPTLSEQIVSTFCRKMPKAGPVRTMRVWLQLEAVKP